MVAWKNYYRWRYNSTIFNIFNVNWNYYVFQVDLYSFLNVGNQNRRFLRRFFMHLKEPPCNTYTILFILGFLVLNAWCFFFSSKQEYDKEHFKTGIITFSPPVLNSMKKDWYSTKMRMVLIRWWSRHNTDFNSEETVYFHKFFLYPDQFVYPSIR